MRKKIKKAFTLVELLVVIAILAILATVSIVGYNSFTKKAKVSNDTALVSQLNTILKADAVINGNAETPTDALKVTEEAGYDVEKLTPTANDYQIIWNQDVNQFALLDEKENLVFGEKSEKEFRNFKFVDNNQFNSNSKYSQYLKGTNFKNELSVGTGIDVGNNNEIPAITYTNTTTTPQNVAIRTKGGTLTINATNDTVHHYDYVKTLSVEAVSDKDCYHEHGFIGTLNKFVKGKFVSTSTTQFFESEEVINNKLGNNKDFTVTPKFSQNIYDENEVSIIDGQPGPNHVHKWNDGKVVEDCTCGHDGKYEYTCQTCGKVDTKVTYATGLHTWGTDNICTKCGKTKENSSGDATLTVDTFLALKNIIENIDDSESKEVKFSLAANLATNATSLITQPRNTKITLDLNGYTLELYNSSYDENAKCYTAGFIAQGAFEIMDSSAKKTGKIIASANSDNIGEGGLITVEKTNKSAIFGKTNAQLVLESGTIDSTNNPYGCAIMMWNSGSLTVSGGTIKANGYAISGSTYDTVMDQSKLIITGGEITSTNSFAIYHPQSADITKGEFTINGGTIKGKEGAIYLGGNTSSNLAKNSGMKLVINDGTFISEKGSIIYINWTYLKDQKGYNTKMEISINGGSFDVSNDSYFASMVADKAVSSSNGSSSINKVRSALSFYINGGTYNVSKEKLSYIKYYENKNTYKEEFLNESNKVRMKDIYKVVDNSDGTWSIVAK